MVPAVSKRTTYASALLISMPSRFPRRNAKSSASNPMTWLSDPGNASLELPERWWIFDPAFNTRQCTGHKLHRHPCVPTT